MNEIEKVKELKRRQLSKEEKHLNENAIKRMQSEIEDCSYLLKDAELKFNEGLDYSYRKQKKEYASLIKDLKSKINGNNQLINTLKEQNEKGVLPKETNKNKLVE